MRKHGVSHGAAVLVCTIASALMADIVKKHVPFVYEIVEKLSKLIIDWVHFQYAPQYMNIIIFAAILAVVWGIAFSFMHAD